jgi:hypothetical protein
MVIKKGLLLLLSAPGSKPSRVFVPLLPLARCLLGLLLALFQPVSRLPCLPRCFFCCFPYLCLCLCLCFCSPSSRHRHEKELRILKLSHCLAALCCVSIVGCLIQSMRVTRDVGVVGNEDKGWLTMFNIHGNGFPISSRGPGVPRLSLQVDTLFHNITQKPGPAVSLAPQSRLVSAVTAGPSLCERSTLSEFTVEPECSPRSWWPIRGSYEKGLVIFFCILTAGSTSAFHVPAFQGNHIEKAGTFSSWNLGLAEASLCESKTTHLMSRRRLHCCVRSPPPSFRTK